MKYTQLGNTDIMISRVSYGGIVSAGFYDNVSYPSEGQEASDHFDLAITLPVNQFLKIVVTVDFHSTYFPGKDFYQI